MALARALIAALHALRVVIARLNRLVNRRQQPLHDVIARAARNHGVELEVKRRVILPVQIGVVHPVQQQLHLHQILLLTPLRRQRRHARLHQQPRLQQLGDELLLIGKAQAQRIAGQPRHRAQERALSLPDVHDVLGLQNLDRLAHRGTAHAKARHQLGLRGELCAGLHLLLNDHLAQLVGNLLGQLARLSHRIHSQLRPSVSGYFLYDQKLHEIAQRAPDGFALSGRSDAGAGTARSLV